VLAGLKNGWVHRFKGVGNSPPWVIISLGTLPKNEGYVVIDSFGEILLQRPLLYKFPQKVADKEA
jgi:hypothetical protein